MTARTARAASALGAVIGVLYLAKAIYRGLAFTRGDYYFTMPGEYARRLNPALWASADLQQAIGFNHGAYLYGPSQYLTLFPVVFLNSYESIASALLVIYPLVLGAAWYCLWRALEAGEERRAAMPALLFAVVFAFLPLTQALIQREFEVVAFLFLAGACLMLVRGRDVASGALLAGLVWFKYWPIVLLGAFVVHRRARGLAAFAATSAAILLVAHLVFGLDHFAVGKTIGTVGGLVRPFGTGEVLRPVIPEGAAKSDFCRQWIWGRGTAVDIRWALCGLEYRVPAFSATAAFAALIAGTAALFLWGAYRVESGIQTASTVKWATIWEFSILTIVGASFVHAHYYYLIVFLLPLSALLFSYAVRPQRRRGAKLTAWAITYILLNAFIVPTSWLSAMTHTDAWALYLDSGACLLGTLLLLALVLWEFTQVTRRAPQALAAG